MPRTKSGSGSRSKSTDYAALNSKREFYLFSAVVGLSLLLMLGVLYLDQLLFVH